MYIFNTKQYNPTKVEAIEIGTSVSGIFTEQSRCLVLFCINLQNHTGTLLQNLQSAVALNSHRRTWGIEIRIRF